MIVVLLAVKIITRCVYVRQFLNINGQHMNYERHLCTATSVINMCKILSSFISVVLSINVVVQCVASSESSNFTKSGFAFEMLMTKLQLLEDHLVQQHESKVNEKVYSSCRQVPSSGVFKIQPEKPFKEPISVLCDQEYESGGWVVIQHRFNGSTNFYRNWKEYKNGFGNLEGEFWLGLDRIYQLTVSQPHELVFLLEDFDGNKTFARYDHFETSDESEKYTVIQIGAFTGTAGDSFSGTKSLKFSTLDADNDTWNNQCAVTFFGAWWYSNCHSSNLNGKYLRGETKEYATGMVWSSFRGQYYALKTSKMMIRPKA